MTQVYCAHCCYVQGATIVMITSEWSSTLQYTDVTGLDKKFELMLTRRAKAYSTFCLQTVSLSPAISLQFILGVFAAAEIAKINKTPYFESSGSFKVTDVDTTKKLVTSTCCDRQHAMPICNHFHERLANNGNIMTFTGVPLFDALVHTFP